MFLVGRGGGGVPVYEIRKYHARVADVYETIRFDVTYYFACSFVIRFTEKTDLFLFYVGAKFNHVYDIRDIMELGCVSLEISMSKREA